jgi:hypothetical protein
MNRIRRLQQMLAVLSLCYELVAKTDILGSSYEWDLEIASIICCDDIMLVHESVAEYGGVGSYKQDLKTAAYA